MPLLQFSNGSHHLVRVQTGQTDATCLLDLAPSHFQACGPVTPTTATPWVFLGSSLCLGSLRPLNVQWTSSILQLLSSGRAAGQQGSWHHNPPCIPQMHGDNARLWAGSSKTAGSSRVPSSQSWDTLSLTFNDHGQVPSEPVSSSGTSHMSATHKFKIRPEPRPGSQGQGTGECEQEKAEKSWVPTEASPDRDFRDLNWTPSVAATSWCEPGKPRPLSGPRSLPEKSALRLEEREGRAGGTRQNSNHEDVGKGTRCKEKF